jgi:peroxiredoxin
VIGVAWNGSTDEMADFVDRHGITFPTLVDDDGSLFAHFDVPYQPAFVFVRSDGSAEVTLGAIGHDELSERLSGLLG